MVEFTPTETVRVPAQTGKAVRVNEGELIAIVDVEGQQIGDLFAYCTDDPNEILSTGHTRAINRKLFVEVGDTLYTNHRRPMLTMVQDTSPGYHDMLYPACDYWRYHPKGTEEWHPSCEENFRLAIRELGHELAIVPMPFNVFQNTPVLEGGIIDPQAAATKAGDRLILRAEMDIILVLTACSVDDINVNGSKCTDLEIQLVREPGAVTPRSTRESKTRE